MTRSGFLDLPVLFVLLGAAAFEAAVVLEWIPVGTEPGEGARFEGVVLVAALIALLAGFVISCVLASLNRRDVAAALFPIAAAALMVAHYHSFDTYYLPSHIRYSDPGQAFSPTWVYSIAIAGLLTSFLSFRKPRGGFSASAVVILLCTFTVLFVGFGK